MNLIALLIVAGIGAVVFGLVIVGMAIGVMVSGRRIKGSCGGLGSMAGSDGRSPCMACGSEPTDCDDARQAACVVEADGHEVEAR